MKECSSCGFETEDKRFNYCPMCNLLLDTTKNKRTYTMGLSAEESHTAEIEMTYEEAKIVSRVLKELSKDCDGWCGNCWIDFEE